MEHVLITGGSRGIGAAAVAGGCRSAGGTGCLGCLVTHGVLCDRRLGNIAECNSHDGGGQEFELRRF